MVTSITVLFMGYIVLSLGVVRPQQRRHWMLKPQQRRTRRAMKVQTTVVIRQHGEWLIAAFQNTKTHPLMAAIGTKIDSRQAPSTLPGREAPAN
ncbi:hypothetical protein AB0L63_11230 [Nocardia sp. NPDC051990]|uniref:hypothetical protein n=1 Tax=Nocardia sp. NPDC051990 TaxID=3155285 RepID=UPI0034329927